jgi:hypothetical protein
MMAERDGRAREDSADLAPSFAANIKVKVQVVQADIPAGISKLLMLMGQNALVVNTGISVKPTQLILPNGSSGIGQLVAELESRRVNRPVTIDYDRHLLEVTVGGLPWESGQPWDTGSPGQIDFSVSFVEAGQKDGQILFSCRELQDEPVMMKVSRQR